MTIKKGYCPKCKKLLLRKRSIHVHKNLKPTICNYCKFKIENPYTIFNIKWQKKIYYSKS